MRGEDPQFWQTEPCPPWCRVEHCSTDDYEDRSCEGETRGVTLSLEQALYVENRDRRDAYGVPLHFDVTAQHRYREAEPLVLIWTVHATESGPRRLTVDEAETFAHAILDAVKEARS